MTPSVVLDADVLFPMILRDTLLRVAAAGCFRAHWSDRILDEVTRNLVVQQRMDVSRAAGLRRVMEEAFPEARVDGWERHEAAMLNHPKDRHVAAAAVAGGASVIVTANLKDFAPLPEGLVAMSPDAFLLSLLERDPDTLVAALVKQAAGYRHPPSSLGDLLDWLARIVPGFAEAVRNRLPE